MLTPDYYESCVDDILKLYAQLEDDIISDIVRRMMKTGFVTESAKHQAEMLQNAGLLYDDILSEIAKRTDATSQHVKALFEDAGVRTVNFDNQIYRAVGRVPVDIRQSPAMRRTLESGYRKTLGNMQNLTLTTANMAQSTYYSACNQAYMQVVSGAFSYQEAIKKAVQKTAQDGAFVLYPSGHRDRVDVAVRRSVLTGVGQTCREIGLMNAEENDCDLMELSAHFGARPTHAEWQGQIVSLSGRKGYLSLDSIGYGTGDGFGGWNCRHDWFPYFEGYSRRNYTDNYLKSLNEKNIEYNGEKYSQYEISQIQRRYEREIRSAKREKVAFDTAVKESSDPELKAVMQSGSDYANQQIKDKQAKMRDFINQTGQSRDYFREQNYGKVIYPKNNGNSLTSAKNSDNINLVNNYHSGIFGELKDKIKNIFTNKSYLPVSEEYFNELPKKVSVYSSYEDMKATNPHYNDSYQYQINCQRCVPAYEMRRRGYNVTAKPAPDDDILGLIFEKIFVDMKWETCPNGSGMDDIREYMKKCGNGARAEISLQTCDGSHLFMAEQHNGITYFIDPQNYKANADLYFKKILIAPTRVCRIDDLKFSELIRECCEKVSE